MGTRSSTGLVQPFGSVNCITVHMAGAGPKTWTPLPQGRDLETLPP